MKQFLSSMQDHLCSVHLLCLAALIASCSQNDSAGNSIETENAVSIQLVYVDGSPAKSTLVRIRPIWYLAVDADTNATTATSLFWDVFTDANGMVQIDSLPNGTFIAHASEDSLAVAHEFIIPEPATSGYSRQITLTPSGSISGIIPLPEGADFATVYILGMEKAVQTDSTGKFLLEGVPEGAVRIQGVVAGVEAGIGEALVQVRAGKKTDIGTVAQLPYGSDDLELWKHNRIVSVDSLLSDWMQPATFPMVVTLRLDSSNFDFSQAMGEGQDIRITDMSNRALPLVRAYWDKERQVATVRFRVESSADVRLWWGRSAAAEIDNDSLLWLGISDSLKNELYTILVDDFEDSLSEAPMQLPIALSGWYFMPSDSEVTYFPTMSDGLLAGIETAGQGRSGKAMHFSYTTQHEGSYVLFGIAMGSGEPRDYSAMDSIVFWTRGTGDVLFAFDKLTGNAGKSVYNDTLDTIWTKHVIQPHDLAQGDGVGGNLGWDMVRDSITNLTFMAGKGTDFWIDDIRIYGLNRDDLK